MTQVRAGTPAELARAEGISQSHPAGHVPQRQGILNTAAAVSRRGVLAAKAELANQALLALCRVVYEIDTGGGLANMDGAGGRILVPLPWGRMGGAKWGLRASEARTLRYIMFNRTAATNPAPA